jgi:hypothetical protein
MKTRPTTELPNSLREIFENKETEYRLDQDYKEPDMDNIQSLRWFIDYVGIPSESIEEDGGTQLILTHSDFKYKLVVDSGGAGDTHSHRYSVSYYTGN